MSKKLYEDHDINDLVSEDLDHEETFFKGGVGSGKRGHKTHRTIAAKRDSNGVETSVRHYPDKEHPYHVYHSTHGWRSAHKDQGEAAASMERHSAEYDVKKSDVNDLVEDLLEKGGEGSGKRGHKTFKNPHEGMAHHKKEFANASANRDPEGMQYHKNRYESHRSDKNRIQNGKLTDAQKYEKMRENDRKITEHKVKTSKESPTGG